VTKRQEPTPHAVRKRSSECSKWYLPESKSQKTIRAMNREIERNT
jgi:3-methyladenine DNA glycosylase AlkC